MTRIAARADAPNHGSAAARGGRGGRGRALPRALQVTAVACAVLVLSGCGLQIPSDPDGTLERITGGQLRVGVASADASGLRGSGTASGEVGAAIEDFAVARDADIVWTAGGEEALVDQLEAGELDLAVGDMTDETPWGDRVSVTRGYSIAGSEQRFVVLLPLGENALQSALETFLDERLPQ